MTPRAFLPLILAQAALATVVMAASQMAGPLVIINETTSMKRGAYVRAGDAAAPAVGQVVALPLGGSARAYLHDRLGYPVDTMLVKRVAGAPGDAVCRAGGVVRVGVRVVEARMSDHRGNTLAIWSGCHRLKSGEVFLLGDAPTSFDGRYFGPTPVAALVGTYREVLT